MGLKSRPKPVIKIDGFRTLTIGTPLIVNIKLSVDRAVTYTQSGRKTKQHTDGSSTDTWDGQASYKNREETVEAGRVYQRAREKIRGLCVHTDLGFMCSEGKEAALRDAVKEVNQIVAEANAKFSYCRISGYVGVSQVLAGDEGSIQAVQDKLSQTTAKISEALKDLDFKKARRALNATKELVNIMQDPKSKRVFMETRQEAHALADEVVKLLKEFDGKDNALATEAGQKVMKRINAAWNF